MKLSVVIPIHEMENAEFFLQRLQNSLEDQSFDDFEVIVSKSGGGMAHNTNRGIEMAEGEIIKIIFMDDYLAHKNSLKDIVDNFKGGWLVTGCSHDNGDGKIFNHHEPSWNDEILLGKNTIGSPSVMAFENESPLLFDEEMTWLLDCDLYKRLYVRYGEPTILKDTNVIIGIGKHQTTNLLSDELKLKEHDYLIKKYE